MIMVEEPISFVHCVFAKICSASHSRLFSTIFKVLLLGFRTGKNLEPVYKDPTQKLKERKKLYKSVYFSRILSLQLMRSLIMKGNIEWRFNDLSSKCVFLGEMSVSEIRQPFEIW